MALTLVRKRRRVKGTYRINDIGSAVSRELQKIAGRDRHSGAKRPTVKLEVGRWIFEVERKNKLRDTQIGAYEK